MVAANFFSGNISVCTNTASPGLASFSAPAQQITGVEPESIAIGDINSDGLPDIAVSSISDHIICIFVNTSTGNNISFAPRIDIPGLPTTWSRGIALADIDGDGKLDLVAADNNKYIDFTTGYDYGTISVYRNNSVGRTVSFDPAITERTNEYPRKVAVGDLNGDYIADNAVCFSTGASVNIFANERTPGTIKLAYTVYIPFINDTEQIAMADFDQDGFLDLAVSVLQTDARKVVFRNTTQYGRIGVDFLNEDKLDPPGPIGFSPGDLDGDGKPDPAVANFISGSVSIYRNTSKRGDISSVRRLDYMSGNHLIDVQIGDADIDRLPDLLVTNNLADMNKIHDPENKVSILTTGPVPLVLDLGDDRLFCSGDSAILNSNLSNATPRGNTGATTSSITVKESSYYWLEVTVRDSTVRDTVQVLVKPNPVIYLGNDSTFCDNAVLVLNAFNDGVTYRWQDGSTGSVFAVRSTGRYAVAVTLNGCAGTDTVDITVNPFPTLQLNGDSVFCYEAKLELTAQVRDAQIRWQDGSTSPNYTVRQAGQYTVTASNNCGTVSQTITVRNAICGLNLPNAFTPNNDGLNDLFRVKYPQFIRTFDMKIYDRWGQLVFHANDPLTGWDGNFKNTKLPSGNYIWNITISDLDGNFSRKTGTVMLIR